MSVTTPEWNRGGSIPYTTARNIFFPGSPGPEENPKLDSFYYAGQTCGSYNYVSYANQFLIPGLNVGGGSSGSVITGYVNDELKILGIWWGAYMGKSTKTGAISWDGCADIFKTRRNLNYDPDTNGSFVSYVHPKTEKPIKYQNWYDNTKLNPYLPVHLCFW